jgi:SAM-dependent methyltransferase
VSFSPEWDVVFRNFQQLSVWPWSDLVSYVMRHAKPRFREPVSATRVLELGFGAGANIPLFLQLGVQYHGLDGSPAITERIKAQFPELGDRLRVGDFTREIPFAGPFDLVFDRAALTHNGTEPIARALRLARRVLKPEGLYIAIDLFSTTHSDYAIGEPVDGDAYTRDRFPRGQFHGLGKVHFFDEQHIRDVFRDFEILVLQHKIIDDLAPARGHRFASWNLVATPRSGEVARP